MQIYGDQSIWNRCVSAVYASEKTARVRYMLFLLHTPSLLFPHFLLAWLRSFWSGHGAFSLCYSEVPFMATFAKYVLTVGLWISHNWSLPHLLIVHTEGSFVKYLLFHCQSTLLSFKRIKNLLPICLHFAIIVLPIKIEFDTCIVGCIFLFSMVLFSDE